MQEKDLPRKKQLAVLQKQRDLILKRNPNVASFCGAMVHCSPTNVKREEYGLEHGEDANFRHEVRNDMSLQSVIDQDDKTNLDKLQILITLLEEEEAPLICSECNKVIPAKDFEDTELKLWYFKIRPCKSCYKKIMNRKPEASVAIRPQIAERAPAVIRR